MTLSDSDAQKGVDKASVLQRLGGSGGRNKRRAGGRYEYAGHFWRYHFTRECAGAVPERIASGLLDLRFGLGFGLGFGLRFLLVILILKPIQTHVSSTDG